MSTSEDYISYAKDIGFVAGAQIEVVIPILLSIIVYFAIVLALRGFNKNELELLKHLVWEFNKKKD